FVDQTGPAGVTPAVQRGLGAEDVSSLTGSDGLTGSQREAGVHGLTDLLDVVAITNGIHSEVHADIDQAYVGLRHVLGPAALPLRSTGKVADLEVHTGRPLGVVGVNRDQLGVVDNVVLDVEGPRRQYPSLLSQEVEGLRVIDLDHALFSLLFCGYRFGARSESNAQSDRLAIGGRFVELATRQRQQTSGGRAVILASGGIVEHVSALGHVVAGQNVHRAHVSDTEQLAYAERRLAISSRSTVHVHSAQGDTSEPTAIFQRDIDHFASALHYGNTGGKLSPREARPGVVLFHVRPGADYAPSYGGTSRN